MWVGQLVSESRLYADVDKHACRQLGGQTYSSGWDKNAVVEDTHILYWGHTDIVVRGGKYTEFLIYI